MLFRSKSDICLIESENETIMKRIVIVGATSGIGMEVARLCIAAGWRVGVAGRRAERLETLRAEAPDRVSVARIDVDDPAAPEALTHLIDALGGMDIYFHVSGIGKQNPDLDPAIELRTLETNAVGFTRMITAAYGYFARQGGGHIAAVSSIAGTKGLGAAPAYSATKRFQNTYLDALAQLARMRRLKIAFTDIRPGFVATDLLDKEHYYPMQMSVSPVARKAFKAIVRRRRRVVIDWRYAVVTFFWRLYPECLWERLRVGVKR